MTAIVRRFNKTAKPSQFAFGEARVTTFGHETRANSLREEYDDIERDVERAVSQARQLIERERVRETER
jgi:hypothetical protein